MKLSPAVVLMVFLPLVGCNNDGKYEAYFNAGGPICDASDVFLKGSCEPGSLCINPEQRACDKPVNTTTE